MNKHRYKVCGIITRKRRNIYWKKNDGIYAIRRIIDASSRPHVVCTYDCSKFVVHILTVSVYTLLYFLLLTLLWTVVYIFIDQ